MWRWKLVVVVFAAVTLLIPACTSKKQAAPALTGPSEMALSVSIQAIPDVLRQDGASQSRVTILARDAGAQPVRNLSLRLDITVGGVLVDYGQLSAKNLVTGSDGTSQVTYTAPAPSSDPSSQGGVIDLLVTPVGSDYANSLSRSVSIRLVPPGVILPPGTPPVPKFVFSPSAPLALSDVTFDASSTTSSSPITSVMWNFGDGTTGSGVVVKHQFQLPGTYTVTLTVIDSTNLSASTTQTVTVVTSGTPKASFFFSPSKPGVGADVVFNAGTSTAATGRHLVAYDWDFGTGRTASGVTVTKTGGYDKVGDYVVTLVVTDDIGQTAMATNTVTVGPSTDPFVSFLFSPTDPAVGDPVTFDASASTSSVGIKSYAWDFGDGGTDSTTSRPVHHYGGARTYVVTLTVTDNSNRTATTTKNVAVK